MLACRISGSKTTDATQSTVVLRVLTCVPAQGAVQGFAMAGWIPSGPGDLLPIMPPDVDDPYHLVYVGHQCQV